MSMGGGNRLFSSDPSARLSPKNEKAHEIGGRVRNI